MRIDMPPLPRSRIRAVPRVLLCVALVTVVSGPLLVRDLTAPFDARFVDLAVYRAAGRLLLDAGRAAPVYGFATPHGLPFTYPPAAALLAVPLGVLPLTLLGALWSLATLAALAQVVRLAGEPLLVRVRQRYGGTAAALATAAVTAGAAVGLEPLRDALRFGQVGVLLAALVLADCLEPQRRT